MDDNPAEPKTLEDLNNLVEDTKVKKEQKATYFTLSALLPPFTICLALYLSWRKKLLYKTLPYQLIFYSTITFVFNIFGLLSVKAPEQTTQLGVVFDPQVSAQVRFWTIITTVLALIRLIVGYYFKNKAKKNEGLDSTSLWISFFIC